MHINIEMGSIRYPTLTLKSPDAIHVNQVKSYRRLSGSSPSILIKMTHVTKKANPTEPHPIQCTRLLFAFSIRRPKKPFTNTPMRGKMGINHTKSNIA